jgi:hypothetical protein
MKLSFFGLIISLFLVGCGYKPTSYYAKEVLGDKIYSQVTVSRVDPKNSVIVKDAINEAILTRFLGKLTTKENADSTMNVTFGSVSFSALVYDDDGYVTSYKAKVTLSIKFKNKSGETINLSPSGEYDFSIDNSGVISDTKRFEAIKYASLDAINEFVSLVSVKGMQNGKHGQ